MKSVRDLGRLIEEQPIHAEILNGLRKSLEIDRLVGFDIAWGNLAISPAVAK